LPLLPTHDRYLREGHLQIPTGFARWAREMEYPPGTYFGNLFWQDFTRLFYAAPEFHYSYGLDPMFAYAADPERYRVLSRYALRREPFPEPAQLKALLGTRFVFVSHVFFETARAMAQKRYALVYQDTDGWCFDLDAPAVDHGIASE